MSSAEVRFFNIAELTNLVTALLNKHDTSALAQTNHRLLELCEPLLYMDVRLDHNPHRVNLFDSIYTTIALARNTHFVRNLRVSVINHALLTNCMLAHLDSVTDEKQNLRPDLPPSLRSTASSSHVIPVPPMTNLERLEVALVLESYISTCFYYLETSNNPKTILLQYCRLLDLSPRLTYFKADRDAEDWSDAKQELKDLEQESPVIREGLQDLAMWPVGNNASEEGLVVILKRCPNLK
ncbi:hypothetical protein BG015_011189 [Linnemannia schmuckeri]|uniref:Uncharacterized protein n=1 Tax=Linnemannia schmuckeri TaxID=64567 RepID=A0A9P5S4R3_9FUNG|nr:hypothetical protein BG015_011189 [Linnemannia schmuckeri]